MKKKLALLMAAIMTVAMVPMTAFASTKLKAVDEISTAVDEKFTSRVQLSSDDEVPIEEGRITVELKLTNGKFTKTDDIYDMETKYGTDKSAVGTEGIAAVDVISDTIAEVTLTQTAYTTTAATLSIMAKAVEVGDVIATFSSNKAQFSTVKAVIATAYKDEILIESDGIKTVVEDSSDELNIEVKPITITALTNTAIGKNDITLKLKGNYKVKNAGTVTLYNETSATLVASSSASDKIELKWAGGDLTVGQPVKITLTGVILETTSKCKVGDVATFTISSDDISSTKLEVAKMVAEAVTYSVEDDTLPVIWAGKSYVDTLADGSSMKADDTNTLELSIEENTGDILNTSRKATFTFPEGIEVVDIKHTDGSLQDDFKYSIDENVVTIRNYAKDNTESTSKVDFSLKFVLNAAPTYSGDVEVKLGGEFDNVSFKVATVKAPYTVEAKTSEVLIDYRYVPVNEIIITEAEEGLLEDNDVIMLEVEKMDFEDAGTYEVTSGDIDVDVDVEGKYLTITVNDESTVASTIKISGLELYLDRTLPVGGYALKNIKPSEVDERNGKNNILWENSTSKKGENYTDYDYVPGDKEASNGYFKYSAVVVNDSYVEVVTQARDQDDYTTNRKIVITIGAATMAVGTETVTLDTPAYINAENYTELPLRAVSEAFGATVNWDDASRTVTVMMGQRIISMTIGSKTMYINGTPVAMNTAPEITNSRTFVPVRDLSNALGITKIDWNEAAKTVTLN